MSPENPLRTYNVWLSVTKPTQIQAFGHVEACEEDRIYFHKNPAGSETVFFALSKVIGFDYEQHEAEVTLEQVEEAFGKLRIAAEEVRN